MKIIDKVFNSGITNYKTKDDIIQIHCPLDFGYSNKLDNKKCNFSRCHECWNDEVKEKEAF